MQNKYFHGIVFLFTFLPIAAVLSQPRETTPVRLDLISKNVYQITGGRGANGGAIIGENGVMVIDSKMDQESVEQTLAEIVNITEKSIHYLVNIHCDGDPGTSL
ncbi:hypothetical protein JW935_04035 [candidate division KSB1 bacterium]|nr:hypothetical protein [candidate division KSB1 bacterium]